MNYEVELKFPVEDAETLWQRLAGRGAVWSEPSTQVDQYYAHPGRSFQETDEALRTRSENGATVLTYKGPVIDRATKTRREIEVTLAEAPESAANLQAILEHLSFRPVREVCKTRRTAVIDWQGSRITCGWDEVPPLGSFLELEVLATDSEKAAAQALILSAASSLGLPAPERRSYLEMLLQHDQR